MQIEAILIPAYGTKIPNHNDQNITIIYWMSHSILSVLNFKFRSLIFICDLFLGAWNFHDFHTRVTLFIPSNYLFKRCCPPQPSITVSYRVYFHKYKSIICQKVPTTDYLSYPARDKVSSADKWGISVFWPCRFLCQSI